MRLRSAFSVFLLLIAVSCSYKEVITPEESIDNSAVEFYATIGEQPDADTKVYADDKLRVLWNADDRITIFNKNTYNQQYRFTGQDGANAGGFRKVPMEDEFVTFEPLDLIYSVYPYQETTYINYDETISFVLPAEQTFLEGSFGIGANTMVSKTSDNQLRFKNVGGYLSLKFYGEGVSLSSITLKGNNGELLAGKSTIDMSSGLPVLTMDEEQASDTITMVFDPAIQLGSSSSDAVVFLFVLPPVTFTKGITISVSTSDGGMFEKSTSNKLEISRSAITRLGALEIVPEYAHPNNVIYYSSKDGEVITPYNSNEENLFGANIISNENVDGKGIITFDGDVTHIGEQAFFSTSLTSIQIPRSVKSIDKEAFRLCVYLTSINIPNSVSIIEGGAFSYCESLVSITIPDSVTELGDYNPFASCSGLSSIIVESGNSKYDSRNNCNAIIRTADNYLVSGCKNTVIPGSVISIGKYAFCDIRGLYSISIPDSVTSIGDDAFLNCNQMRSVKLSNTLTRIGKHTFQFCDNLQSIIIPESVYSIGSYAFDGAGLVSITLRAPLPPTVGEYALNSVADCPIFVQAGSVDRYRSAWNWDKYKDRIRAIPEQSDNHNNVIYYTSASGNVIVPNNVSGFGSVYYVTNEYVGGQGVIVYDGDVTSIDRSAFSSCTDLTSITIPESVTSVGYSAFSRCVGLATITIPESVTSIGSSAFSGCKGLTSITIPESVTSIGSSAFSGCKGLTSITIPESVTSIGASAFANCQGLTSITIPESITSVDDYVFSGCSGLTSITIPESVTSIGSNAFSSCEGLTSVKLPNSLISIGVNAFSYSSLQSIEIPDSVTSIDPSAFFGCTGLASIVVGSGNPVYDSRNNCNALIETETNELILGCKNTTIPESVTSIGLNAFYQCVGLTSITIPESVTSIGFAAFSNCSEVTSITIKAKTPPIVESISFFIGTNNVVPIFVPAESVEAYKTTEYWSFYANRIQAIQEQ